jgi:predicted short-subunit dehydrogenase-like oxidoreductase (DUF2520 family)
MNIGFIGAGKVGNTLGKYFELNKLDLSGYYDIDQKSAKEAADFTSSVLYTSADELVKYSDIIFITTTDNTIEKVWNSIKELSIEGKVICHCSGALSSSVFSGVSEKRAYGYSIHPLFACSSKTDSYKALKNSLFTIEGSPEYLDYFEQLFKKMGNSIKIIDSASKVKYHAAAVFASNQIISLARLGVDLLTQCGFNPQEAVQSVTSLMRYSIENIENQGLTGALTGPVERNDVSTIAKHLQVLSERERDAYVVLSGILIDIAKDKNPDKDYMELHNLLKNGLSA